VKGKTKIITTSVLAGLGGLAVAALALGPARPAPSRITTPAPRVEVRTVVIRRTIHRTVRRRAPEPAGGSPVAAAYVPHAVVSYRPAAVPAPAAAPVQRVVAPQATPHANAHSIDAQKDALDRQKEGAGDAQQAAIDRQKDALDRQKAGGG
jgi:hypothetical protein